MKKLLFFCLSLITASSLSAQTASFSVQDSVISYASGPVELHAVVTNLTSGGLQLEWKKAGASMNTQQFISICDNHNCYTSAQALTTTVYTSGAIQGAGTADWYGSFDGSTVASGSSVYYTINLKDVNTGYNKNVTYVLRKFAAGINPVPADAGISFFPNPAHGALNVVYNENAGIRSVAIFNLIGKPVASFKVAGSGAQLDIDDIPSGVYMIRFMNGQGDVLATRRFTKQ